MANDITTVTFKIQSSNKTFTVNCENKGYTDAILGRFINGEITEAEADKLRKAAAGNGKDKGVIEACEIENDFCRNAAERGYYEKYDIINNGNDVKVRVKKTGAFYPDPEGKDIKSDFGLAPGVLFSDNEDLFKERKDFLADETSPWADFTEFNAGDILEMRKNEIHLQEKPRGFWGRFF